MYTRGTKARDIKSASREDVARQGRAQRMAQNANVRKQKTEESKSVSRGVEINNAEEETVNAALLEEMMRVRNSLPPEKAAVVNDIAEDSHHSNKFVNFLLINGPLVDQAPAADSLLNASGISLDRQPSRAELVEGMNRVFQELPKIAKARGWQWGDSEMDALKNVVRSGLFDSADAPKNMSKQLEEYMRTHGIVQLSTDRDLSAVCTFHEMEYADVPDASGLLATFGTISIPDEATKKVHCFSVLALENYILGGILETVGIGSDTLSNALAMYYARGLRTDAASIPQLAIRNPATGKLLTGQEIIHIGEWADKVRVLKSLLDGTGAFTLTPADLDALIHLRGLLAPSLTKSKMGAPSKGVWGRIMDVYNVGAAHLSTLLDNMGIIWIIRQMLCMIARMLAMSLYISKIGAEAGVGLLATYIKQNMSKEVKDAIAGALSGAAAKAPPPEGLYSFVSMIKSAAAKIATTIGETLGRQTYLPDDVYMKIARNLFVGSITAASGGWTGILKHVISSYGTFLVGNSIAVMSSKLYTIWTAESYYDKAFAIMERLGMTIGRVGYFVKALQSVYAFVVPVLAGVAAVLKKPIAAATVAGALLLYVPTLGPSLLAFYGPVALCQTVYYGIAGYFTKEIIESMYERTSSMFTNPLLADVSSLQTFLLISTPSALCKFFTKGTYSRSVCDGIATFISTVIQSGKIFSLFVQSVSDVWYIQHILRTGVEPTNIFGLPWKPSRCLSEWTHGSNAAENFNSIFGTDVLAALEAKPGVRGGMVAEYIPEFIRTFAAEEITRPGKATLIMEAALHPGGQRLPKKRASRSKSIRRKSSRRMPRRRRSLLHSSSKSQSKSRQRRA